MKLILSVQILLAASTPVLADPVMQETEIALQRSIARSLVALKQTNWKSASATRHPAIVAKLEAMAGPALYSYDRDGKSSFSKAPGATVRMDSIRVPHENRTFTRYAFIKDSRDVSLAIYKDDQDHFFAFYWEMFSLMTEADFSDRLLGMDEKRRKDYLADTWVELAVSNDVLKGTFYSTDNHGRVSISLQLEDNAVVIKRKSGGQAFLLPIGNTTETIRFDSLK